MATVESASYDGNGSIIAVIDGRTVGIPDDIANMDRVSIAEWEAAGGVIAPYVEPPAPRQMVLKSVVQSRIIEAGKMDAAYAALTSNPVYFARWFAPDRPAVYCDDPDAVALVTALGLDPAVILAP